MSKSENNTHLPGAGADLGAKEDAILAPEVVERIYRLHQPLSFRNETTDLLARLAWLLQEGCTHVGMEGFFDLVVANAQHIKAVPGRKTDVQDAE